MNTGGKKLLLVVYGFPPFPGIGGRRWAKFARYLIKSGIEVDVVTIKYSGEKKSEWLNETRDIPRYEFPDPKGILLSFPPTTLLDKVKYHLTVWQGKTFGKGWHFDKAFFIRKKVQYLVRKRLSTGEYSNVIVSGAPYHLCHHMVALKPLFPEVRFIVDYRDGWTGDTEKYSRIPPAVLEVEKQLESEVVHGADHIITVNDTIARDLQHAFGKSEEHFTTIPNGFDPDDVAGGRRSSTAGHKLNLVFAGNLYQNLEYVLEPFKKAIRESGNSFGDSRPAWDFYGTIPDDMFTFFKELQPAGLTFHGTKSKAEISRIISQATGCLLFIQRIYKDSFSTKFIEYYGARKPIILFGERGQTADYIEKHGIGVSIAPDEMETGIKRALAFISNLQDDFESRFTDEQFNVIHLTERLKKILA